MKKLLVTYHNFASDFFQVEHFYVGRTGELCLVMRKPSFFDVDSAQPSKIFAAGVWSTAEVVDGNYFVASAPAAVRLAD